MLTKTRLMFRARPIAENSFIHYVAMGNVVAPTTISIHNNRVAGAQDFTCIFQNFSSPSDQRGPWVVVGWVRGGASGRLVPSSLWDH